jgi:dipeptidyl aminopeptidase/acylaminoacyl peptidase
MQDDVTDGARWLVEAGIADPERLCIVGGSYGGYAAMMGAIKTPDLFRCAVSINGALDLPHLIMEARNYIGGREWTKSIGLSDEKAAAVSPHDRTDEIDIPVLVIQTADDRVVPPDQAQRFVDRLRGLNKDVRFEWLEAGGHDVYDAEARLRILEALEKFLAATIGTG